MISPTGLKSDELIPFEEAILLIEATFNYQYGFISKSYKKSVTDTITIPLNGVNEQYIEFSAIKDIYKTLNNSIYNLFQQSNLPEKHIKFIDIECDSFNIIAYVVLGSIDSKKSSGWLGAKPFNNQQYKTWPLCAMSHYAPGTSLTIDYNGGVPNAQNEVIDLPLEGSTSYIYRIKQTDWITDFGWASYYVQDPQITPPSLSSSCFFHVVEFYLINSYGSSVNSWLYANSDLHFQEINYKDMNKIYNNIMLATVLFKPSSDREPINAIFGTRVRDVYYEENWNGLTNGYNRYLDGVLQITYASKSKYPIGENALMPYYIP